MSEKEITILSTIPKTIIFIKLFSDISFIFLMSTTIIIFSIIFLILSHPLSLGLIIIAQTLIICLNYSLLSKISWFSYILFLIFLGAIIVLFIYVASLAANEIFYQSNIITLFTITPLIVIFFNDILLIPNNIINIKILSNTSNININTSEILSMIFRPPYFLITLFIAAYLLLTLFIVVKLRSKFTGPMWSNN